jgi:hypothetical protein
VRAGAHGVVAAVSRSATHTVSKANQRGVHLLVGVGVEGDVHAGKTVKHRSRVARDPTQPNLRQVHLIHAELHDELREAGFAVSPGQIQRGLMAATLARDGDGTLVRKAGVMAVVVASGDVRPGDAIRVELPLEPHRMLEPV